MRSKTILISLIIVMLGMLVVYYLLGTGLVKQRHENQALASRLDDKAGQLAQTLQPSQDLDAQLAEAEQNLTDAIGSIPTDLNSTHMINDILKLAEACQVKAVLLTAAPWSAGNMQGYRVLKINMSLEGSIEQVHFFLDQMENVEFKTIIIEGLTVTRAEETTETVQAQLSLSIYSRYNS